MSNYKKKYLVTKPTFPHGANITFGFNCPRRDFAQKAKSRGGTLVTCAYIKESTYS